MSSAGWTPADLAGLELWFDAADASTITESGGTITEWADKSGNARHLERVSGTFSSVASGINSLGSVSLASAAIRTVVNYPFTGDIEATVFAVADKQVSANGCLLGWGGSFNTLSTMGIFDTGGSNAQVAFGGGNAYFTSTFPVGARIDTVRKAPGAIAATTGYWRNGIDLGYGASNDTPNVTLGRFWLGSWTGYGPNRFQGLVGEVVVCSSALSTDDRQKVEGYLAHKWGLEASLPADHPYKDAPPSNGVARLPIGTMFSVGRMMNRR